MNLEKSPYEPPHSDVESKNIDALNVIPAGKWLRFFNFLIDYLGMLLLVYLVFFVADMLMGEALMSIVENVPDFVFGVVMFLLYYLPLEFFTSRTLGKLITGTRVVTEDGLKPSFMQILGRTASRLVPFEPLSFFGWEGRGWHDRWPKTYVVKCR